MAMLHEGGALLTGLGLGVGLMYLFDPERGRRRRALVRDQLTHSAHVGANALGATSRDLAHRTSGAISRVMGAFHHEEADDVVLVDRVRSHLGRLVSHPHAIEVKAANGVVTLKGRIVGAEVRRLVTGIERVRGVRDVVNELDRSEETSNVPALQGATASGPLAETWQREWSPTTRLVVGTAGTALAGCVLAWAARNAAQPDVR